MKEDSLTSSEKFKIKFVSGFLGSFVSVSICSPIDLIKVRLQTSVSDLF